MSSLPSPLLGLDVTQSGVLQSDTDEDLECQSQLLIRPQLSVWSTRHQICLQITHSDNVTVSFRFGHYDEGSQMSEFLYLNINWILLAPLNGGEDVCGESEATVGQGSIYRRYLLFRLHHTKSVQIWCFTWNGKVFDLTGTFTLNKYQAEIQSETKLRNCRCSPENVSSLLTDRIPFSFANLTNENIPGVEKQEYQSCPERTY